LKKKTGLQFESNFDVAARTHRPNRRETQKDQLKAKDDRRRKSEIKIIKNNKKKREIKLFEETGMTASEISKVLKIKKSNALKEKISSELPSSLRATRKKWKVKYRRKTARDCDSSVLVAVD